MRQLHFDDFITCFRKQFIFQKTGRGGKRISEYYTLYNSEQDLKNAQWALMVFIHTAKLYGFSEFEMIDELKIRNSLFEILKEESEKIMLPNYEDKCLQKKVLIKIGLVKNCVFYTHKVRV